MLERQQVPSLQGLRSLEKKAVWEMTTDHVGALLFHRCLRLGLALLCSSFEPP